MSEDLIDSRLYTLCRTFDEMGLKVVRANYNPSKNKEEFVCQIFFAEGIQPTTVYDKLKLPQLLIRSNQICISSDDSWGITELDDNPNQCMLYMSMEKHVSLIVWILHHYAIK